MAPNSTIQPYVDEARRQFGRANPYRVGFLVGQAHAEVVCPYAPGSRGSKCYHLGLAAGRRATEAKQLGENGL